MIDKRTPQERNTDMRASGILILVFSIFFGLLNIFIWQEVWIFSMCIAGSATGSILILISIILKKLLRHQ
jgi:uncharacterized membrane protein